MSLRGDLKGMSEKLKNADAVVVRKEIKAAAKRPEWQEHFFEGAFKLGFYSTVICFVVAVFWSSKAADRLMYRIRDVEVLEFYTLLLFLFVILLMAFLTLGVHVSRVGLRVVKAIENRPPDL